MGKGTLVDNSEQQLMKLERLLEQQIKAARSDDFVRVQQLADEFTMLATANGHTVTVKHRRDSHKNKLMELHRQLECIIADKLAVTEQQLRDVRHGQKLLGMYRP
jgi:hypothetical protein